MKINIAADRQNGVIILEVIELPDAGMWHTHLTPPLTETLLHNLTSAKIEMTLGTTVPPAIGAWTQERRPAISNPLWQLGGTLKEEVVISFCANSESDLWLNYALSRDEAAKLRDLLDARLRESSHHQGTA